MKRLYCALAMGLVALGFAGDAFGEGDPSRNIRIVVPFPAGGGVDTMARIIGKKLSERVGQPVLVENKPGAGGNIGADVVEFSAGRLHLAADRQRPLGQPGALPIAAVRPGEGVRGGDAGCRQPVRAGGLAETGGQGRCRT